MNEEEAGEAADAVVRGGHRDQATGEAKIARDIERLRRFLRDLFTDKDDDDRKTDARRHDAT
jgi:hypothetical protein